MVNKIIPSALMNVKSHRQSYYYYYCFNSLSILLFEQHDCKSFNLKLRFFLTKREGCKLRAMAAAVILKKFSNVAFLFIAFVFMVWFHL